MAWLSERPRGLVDRAAVYETGLLGLVLGGLFDGFERGFELVELVIGEFAEVGALVADVGLGEDR